MLAALIAPFLTVGVRMAPFLTVGVRMAPFLTVGVRIRLVLFSEQAARLDTCSSWSIIIVRFWRGMNA
jgi:hypothetical protein